MYPHKISLYPNIVCITLFHITVFFLPLKVLTNVPPICEIVRIQFPETDKSEKRSITS